MLLFSNFRCTKIPCTPSCNNANTKTRKNASSSCRPCSSPPAPTPSPAQRTRKKPLKRRRKTRKKARSGGKRRRKSWRRKRRTAWRNDHTAADTTKTWRKKTTRSGGNDGETTGKVETDDARVLKESGSYRVISSGTSSKFRPLYDVGPFSVQLPFDVGTILSHNFLVPGGLDYRTVFLCLIVAANSSAAVFRKVVYLISEIVPLITGSAPGFGRLTLIARTSGSEGPCHNQCWTLCCATYAKCLVCV